MIGTDDERDFMHGSSAFEPGGPRAPARRALGERWVADHGDALWRFCMSRTKSPEAAEDIVQETLLAALEGFPRFEGGSSERTWLLGIAAHKVADHFRRLRRETRAGLEPASAGAGASLADMFTPEGKWARMPAWPASGNSLEMEAELAALRRCVEALPQGQAEVVWLRDMLGLPGEQVCKAAGVSPTNLWTRLHRARSALRLCMERALRKEAGR